MDEELQENLTRRCHELAGELVARASALNRTVSTAESCTAGMVSSCIASISGASSVLMGGAATYTEEIKERVLGVSPDTLARCTAVSHETAREMADGSRRLFCSDAAVSVTGYAGPGGGTSADPVGTVYLGLSTASGTTSECRHFEGSRACVRLAATARALELLLGTLV